MIISRTLRTGGAALVVAAAVTLAGCSEDSTEPGPPTDGATSTPRAEPTEIEFVDRSAELLSGAVNTTPLAETTGTWDSDITKREVTLKVYSVDAYATGTRLVFSITTTADEGIQRFPYNSLSFWNDFPRLVEPGTETVYYVNHWKTNNEHANPQGASSYLVGKKTPFAPVTSLHPPLPAGTDTVEIRTPGLDPITVPVSWP